jgi:hypothetical protein
LEKQGRASFRDESLGVFGRITVSEFSMEMQRGKKLIRTRSERLSELLRHVSENAGDRISLGEIAHAMADRSFGAFLVVFCLPNLIPLPPGATFVLGLPLVFITFQMAFSYLDRIWLPKRLHGYAFDNRAFSAMLDRVVPWMQKIERLVTPRYWPERSRLYERLVGLFCLLLAIIVFLPIPFGNIGPSFAMALMGLGLTERDGVVLGVGMLVGAAFTAVIGYVSYALLLAVPYFFQHLPDYWSAFTHYFS